MFDQLKQLKALQSLMANREQIQAQMQAFQDELAKKTVTADAGAGAVRVTVTGKLEVQRVEIDPAMVSALTGDAAEDNKALIEELIAAATNEALRRAQDLVRQEMSRMAGGMNLPGLEGLMGG